VLSYDPENSIAHRLDPRTKLAVQVGFALAAFSHTNLRGLAVATALVGVVLAAASVPPQAAVWEARYALPFLVAGPVFATVTLGPPWIAPGEALVPALSSYRVLLVLVVSAAYVRTTPVRDSRAAIQRLLPGRFGRACGIGVALVFRFLPVLLADLTRARAAMQARLGSERALTERMELLAVGGVRRAFARADGLALALRARCFAWNPTLPALHFSRMDYPALALAFTLFTWALV
jgi:biotin transport system permease protein